jgi:hypothetical protein
MRWVRINKLAAQILPYCATVLHSRGVPASCLPQEMSSWIHSNTFSFHSTMHRCTCSAALRLQVMEGYARIRSTPAHKCRWCCHRRAVRVACVCHPLLLCLAPFLAVLSLVVACGSTARDVAATDGGTASTPTATCSSVCSMRHWLHCHATTTSVPTATSASVASRCQPTTCSTSSLQRPTSSLPHRHLRHRRHLHSHSHHHHHPHHLLRLHRNLHPSLNLLTSDSLMTLQRLISNSLATHLFFLSQHRLPHPSLYAALHQQPSERLLSSSTSSCHMPSDGSTPVE